MSSSGGFGGTIESVGLPDAIRLMCMSGRTVALTVSVGQKQGTIFFQDGEIVHAAYNDLEGEDAFFEIIGWKGGEFSLRALTQNRERTILDSWEGLLLESARRDDEAKMEAEKKMSSHQEASQPAETISTISETKPVDPTDPYSIGSNSLGVAHLGQDSSTSAVDGGGVPPELFDFERYESPMPAEPGRSPVESPSETPVEPMQPSIDSDTSVPMEPAEALESMGLSTPSEQLDDVPHLPIPKGPFEPVQDDPELPEKSTVLEIPDQEPPVEPDRPKEQRPTFDGLTPSATPSPPPSDQPAGRVQDDILSFSDEMIKQALNHIVQRYVQSWPKDADSIRFDSIDPKTLPEQIYNHFLCRFLQLAMQVIRLDDMPFDFNSAELTKAVQDIYQILRNNWLITKDQFWQIIYEANYFDIHRSIDPAEAIAQFLDRRTSGNVLQMRPLIQTLIQHNLIEEHYTDLLTDIEDPSETVDPRKTANFIQTILYKKSEKQSYRAVLQAMQRMLNVLGYTTEQPSPRFQIDVIIKMLETHGLVKLAKFVQIERKIGKESLTIAELDAVMDRRRIIMSSQS